VGKDAKALRFHTNSPYKDFMTLVVFMYLRYLYHTKKKNTDSLVIASKENGTEVNAGKTQHMVMSRDQNAGRSHNIKIDNSAVERAEDCKYLGTT
jgi:hypothetical protein